MNRKPASPDPSGKRQLAAIAVERVVSGGQTGADRAALDFAIERGIPHGGWCPRGRLAEDGPIELKYALRETPSPNYAQRTEWNVRDSCGTVIFSIAPTLTGGSQATRQCAEALGKPCLHLSRGTDGLLAAERLRQFLREHGIRVLNVAGPRSSTEPDIGGFVTEVLLQVLMRMR
jgi:hypothetical protein